MCLFLLGLGKYLSNASYFGFPYWLGVFVLLNEDLTRAAAALEPCRKLCHDQGLSNDGLRNLP